MKRASVIGEVGTLLFLASVMGVVAWVIISDIPAVRPFSDGNVNTVIGAAILLVAALGAWLSHSFGSRIARLLKKKF